MVEAKQGAATAHTDPVLYRHGGKVLFDGRYGRLAEVQAAINASLARCGKPGLSADGSFGALTRDAVTRLTPCLGLQLPQGSAAHQGAITAALWRAVLPQRPLPTVEERSQTIVLTYEATDYDRLEWNFCQSKPLWDAANPTAPCYTNDPRSYITWGPRGATAGHGREVQWILWRIDREAPAEIDAAFGADAAVVRRLLTLENASARRLLCSVFADRLRRSTWTSCFSRLGASARVRALYDHHYLTRASDGWKMEVFHRVYQRLGLPPTEVDHAFYLDRSTHWSPPRDAGAMAARVQATLTVNGWSATPAGTRRAIAHAYPAANQTRDRLGRDVAFFVDSLTGAELTEAERSAWEHRGKLATSHLGLDDARPAPPLQVLPPGTGPRPADRLDPLPDCPVSVLNPLKPIGAS